jgi:chromosome segregation ATPase
MSYGDKELKEEQINRLVKGIKELETENAALRERAEKAEAACAEMQPTLGKLKTDYELLRAKLAAAERLVQLYQGNHTESCNMFSSTRRGCSCGRYKNFREALFAYEAIGGGKAQELAVVKESLTTQNKYNPDAMTYLCPLCGGQMAEVNDPHQGEILRCEEKDCGLCLRICTPSVGKDVLP